MRHLSQIIIESKFKWQNPTAHHHKPFSQKTVWQAIIKKQTLPQKFKQKAKFCHTNLSCHTEPLTKYPLKYKKHLKYKNKKREKTNHKAVLSKI